MGAFYSRNLTRSIGAFLDKNLTHNIWGSFFNKNLALNMGDFSGENLTHNLGASCGKSSLHNIRWGPLQVTIFLCTFFSNFLFIIARGATAYSCPPPCGRPCFKGISIHEHLCVILCNSIILCNNFQRYPEVNVPIDHVPYYIMLL